MVIDLHGEAGETGHEMLAALSFTVYGEDTRDEDSKEPESGKNVDSHNLGTTEVSSGSKIGPWSPVTSNYGLGPEP